MVGKIDYDETRLAHISAWVGGRIDRLFVDYAGMRVRKGDHLVEIYSPDLRTAQEEYLIALRRWQAARKGGDADEAASAEAIKGASRKKLELWGVQPAQIDDLEKSGRTDDRITIYSPIGGTVIERDAFVGKYVMMGERLFTIAGLDTVWALLDAYEIDIGWIRYGQAVVFESDAYPAETFKGRIAFIQPVLNEMTRTVKVRVNVPNPEGKLRPGMYVRARLDITLDEAGRVRNNALADKWMCPMHPEIIKPGPGTCDNCGMPLEETAKLGFSHAETPAKRVLSIPATAPLLTGKRAIVYVEERKGDEVAYVGREIELGDRAGDHYVVRSGLAEGERVVTRGNFKIDSALQIMAKPSMMKAQEVGAGGEAKKDEARPQFPPVAEMQPALDAYLALADALAADDAAKAAGAIVALKAALANAEGKGLSGDAHHKLGPLLDALRKALPADVPAEIAGQRKLLLAVTKPLGDCLRAFHHGMPFTIVEAYCPMAFDNKGAAWFQKGADIRNPYFGAQMLKCGEVKRELKPAAGGDVK
jgi:Cu(I)/Ag(I) efflux system membrane fusion protein